MAKSKPSTVEIEVHYDEGCWQAAGIHHGIFTTGQTLDELWANLCEAASLYFDVPAERLPQIVLKIPKMRLPSYEPLKSCVCWSGWV
jgi:predicted RNase H-like HicB family nuclease